jgi:hypothetical protein
MGAGAVPPPYPPKKAEQARSLLRRNPTPPGVAYLIVKVPTPSTPVDRPWATTE